MHKALDEQVRRCEGETRWHDTHWSTRWGVAWPKVSGETTEAATLLLTAKQGSKHTRTRSRKNGHVQFLNAILALETFASVDLLLAMREVLRGRRALGALRALLRQRGEDLRTPNLCHDASSAAEKQGGTHVFRLLFLLFLCLGLLSGLLLSRGLLLLGGVGVDGLEERREHRRETHGRK